MAALDASHRVVVPALAVVVTTGLLMTASDTDTFFGSRLYWSKMGLVGLLLLNGLGLLAAERAIAGERPKGWRWLGAHLGGEPGAVADDPVLRCLADGRGVRGRENG